MSNILLNISEEDAHILAECYDFSGGQMENIAMPQSGSHAAFYKFLILRYSFFSASFIIAPGIPTE